MTAISKNLYMNISRTLLLLAMLALYPCISMAQHSEAKMSPFELARHVSDLIVRETKFEFAPAIQKLEDKRVLMVEFDVGEKGTYVARTQIKAEKMQQQPFGNYFAISHPAGEVEVYLKEHKIYAAATTTDGIFEYTGYSLFKFQQRIPVAIADGRHPLIIKFKPKNSGTNRMHVTFLQSDNGLPNKAIGFRSPLPGEAFSEYKYIWAGPLSETSTQEAITPHTTANEIAGQELEGLNGKPVRWDLPKRHLVKELPGSHPFQNWHYSTGVFLDAMEQVNTIFPELDYSDYINQHLDFFLENRNQIQRMMEEYGIIEPVFGHYFRFSLLDDMGMQTVPYINRLLKRSEEYAVDSEEFELAQRVTSHILTKAARLPDGTFARFNPDSMVVWADDLYMGSVVLLKMHELTGEGKYLDEVINQVKLFDHHLKDAKDNLYWHGWFSRNGEPSSTKWARANGWTMMAKTELLLAMNEADPRRKEMLEIFRRHAAALLKVQSPEGSWHQVLNAPSTYLETSATAMFVRAYALGVTNGWLENELYTDAIEKGWIALTHQVDKNGDISGIVRGTPILFSDEEYANWRPRKNDPRGLGSIIYAALAVEEYHNFQTAGSN